MTENESFVLLNTQEPQIDPGAAKNIAGVPQNSPDGQPPPSNPDNPPNNDDQRRTLAQCFGILDTIFSVVGFLLLLAGFWVSSWKGQQPLSMFYLVFVIFQRSAAKADPFIPVGDHTGFSVVGIMYFVVLSVSWFLQWCRWWKVGLSFKLFAGLMMVIAVFTYCCKHEYAIADVTAAMFIAFFSGLCMCCAVVCRCASRYNEEFEEDFMTKYFASWDKYMEIATAVFFSFALIFVIATTVIPGWNSNSTIVWQVHSHKKTTQAFSCLVIISFFVTIIGLCLAITNIWCERTLENVSENRPESEVEWLRRIYKFILFISGGLYIFAISAFTFDMYRGIDGNTLVPGPALSVGWIAALFYAIAFSVQSVLILKAAFPDENEKDLARYLACVIEIMFLIAVFFVPIRRNLEPVSMFFNIFGNRPCNSSSGQYILPDPKRMTSGVGWFYFVVRLFLVFGGTITSMYLETEVKKNGGDQAVEQVTNQADEDINNKQTSNDSSCATVIQYVFTSTKLLLGLMLFICTSVYWGHFNNNVTDMTMVLVCLMFASFAVMTGASVEIYQLKEKQENLDENGIGPKFQTYMTICCKQDLVAGIFLFVGLILQTVATVVSGWKLPTATSVKKLGDHCHSMNAFSTLVVVSFAFHCLWFISFLVKCFCLNACQKTATWITKTFAFLGGCVFSFATAALFLDISTGVDAETWSQDAPFYCALSSSIIYSLGFLLTFILIWKCEDIVLCCSKCFKAQNNTNNGRNNAQNPAA